MTPEIDAPPQPFQFTLGQLALAFIGLSLALALIVQLGVFGFTIVAGAIGVAALYWGNRRENRMVMGLGFIVLMVAGGLFLLLGIAGAHGPAARRMSCQNNLHQIAIALQSYHDSLGSFPPAYIADANGKPMHSWRVLILPYLEEQAMYNAYKFDEPWDGPNNRRLAAKIPRNYRCPSDSPRQSPPSLETSYVAIVGPNTVWPEEKSVNMKQITDGTSQTLLVVEVHDSGIHWMEPRDLHVLQMPMAINPIRGQGISSIHGSGNDRGRGQRAQVVLCDGAVKVLDNDLPPETLRALLTIAGEETLQDF